MKLLMFLYVDRVHLYLKTITGGLSSVLFIHHVSLITLTPILGKFLQVFVNNCATYFKDLDIEQTTGSALAAQASVSSFPSN